MTWAETSEGPQHAAQPSAASADEPDGGAQMGLPWTGRDADDVGQKAELPETIEHSDAGDAVVQSPDAGGSMMGSGLEEWLEERVSLVGDEGLRAMGVSAQAHGYLWVALDAPGPQFRGRLGLFIEESVESELERLGALSPGIHASTGLDASLSDQLYRARLLEKRGIALTVPSLEGICNLGRILDAEDGAVLRWWIAAAADRPVRVVVSRRNSSLRVYPSPVLFESLFDVAPFPASPRPPNVQMAESHETMELSELPPEVASNDQESLEPQEDAQTSVLGTSLGPVGETDSMLEELWDSAGVDLSELDRALGLSEPPGQSELPAQTELPAQSGAAANVAEETGEGLAAEELAQEADAAEEPAQEAGAAEKPAQEALAAEEQNHPEPVSEEQSEDALAAQEQHHEAHPAEPTSAAGHAEQQASDDEADDETPLMPPALDANLRRSEQAIPVAPEVAAEGQEDELSESSSAGSADVPSAALVAQEAQAAADSPADATGPDDLDAEEFLRTLAQDSVSAPEVAEQRPFRLQSPLTQAEPSRVGGESSPRSDEPSPLPTKKIKPFLRLATEEEQGQLPATEEEHGQPPVAEQAEQLAASAPVSAAESAETPADERAEPELDLDDPFTKLAQREWRKWAKNLSQARGPKPLSVVERMFVTDYTRLREAYRRGIADGAAFEVLEEWRDAFKKSYSEAFEALKVRGKRPTMVLDLPDVGQRLARLQGARRLQLLLIDGMRFDLGLMIQERMKSKAEAALTERLLLWSALPTTTSVQLELLGRGSEGLKEPLPNDDEPPALVARGQAARTARRVRTGHLEVHKIDVIQDALRDVGTPVLSRFGQIADAASDAICAHLEKQPPRTLVVVFGDHGFALDSKRESTTAEVQEGGASPEEVLVPAFAWLTGAVH